MKLLHQIIFIFVLASPCLVIAQDKADFCPQSVRLIFGNGNVRCLSEYPALANMKGASGVSVNDAARKAIYSLARNPALETWFQSWNYSNEDGNDARALERCQNSLSEKIQKLQYKKIENNKCTLVLSAKAPLGALRVIVSEDEFNEAFGASTYVGGLNQSNGSVSAEFREPENDNPLISVNQSATASLANRRALVIGNDSYKKISRLSNAREDARTIASNLSSVGYQVMLKLDVTEKEMKAVLRTFAGQVEGGDEVLFYFAGHGVQLGVVNYLLPIDIAGDNEAQVRDESIQLQRVLDDMVDKKAKFTLAVIDACRDNPFKTTGRAIGGRGLAPTTAATGQMIIFSAGVGQQALDKLGNSDKSKNGVFTRVFVKEMQKPNLSIDRVVKNVRNQVADLAKSVGHEQVPAIYDQVLGDFYFRVEN